MAINAMESIVLSNTSVNLTNTSIKSFNYRGYSQTLEVSLKTIEGVEDTKEEEEVEFMETIENYDHVHPSSPVDVVQTDASNAAELEPNQSPQDMRYNSEWQNLREDDGGELNADAELNADQKLKEKVKETAGLKLLTEMEMKSGLFWRG
ncbi:Uncharacterized protein Fot_13101 [Forsythia ovata]|uniref:Uncharacterized protein n=1 Tax=Forsythia ovata TaxID=205694 RepID=A0ABD1W2I0_9LAMI